MHDADPANRDVIRLMVNSYYNLGLRDLQRGDANSALEKLISMGDGSCRHGKPAMPFRMR